jgi:RecB family exonuclease
LVVGRIDRVERRLSDGAVRVVDLKTGSSKPSVADLARHPQLGIYQVAVGDGAFASLGSTSGGAALVQLGKAAGAGSSAAVQPQSPLVTDTDPTWAHDLLASAADGMSGVSVSAARGSHCRRCPVRTSCPVQTEGERL